MTNGIVIETRGEWWRKAVGQVEFHVTPNNIVGWMSDWDRAEEFVQRGIFRRTFGGPETYGHVSYQLI